MSHTPGPWVAFYKHKYDEWHVGIPMPDSSMKWALFDDGIASPNPEGDARLIAAAPDLLEHLKGMCEAMGKALTYLPANTLAVYCGEWLASSNDVIAKATDTYKIPASAKGQS